MTKDENAKDSPSTKSGKKEQKSSKRGGNARQAKMKPPTKIVIRRLPPSMTEEEFLKQVDPLPEYDAYYFATADWSLGQDATCRAYITLKNYEDLFLFRDRFDGYVFVDSKGAEYPAIVEFAPFQGPPKNKSRRVFNKINTIEQEAEYQEFVARLLEEREAVARGGEIKLEFSLDNKKEEITSTPLLQYLANKKEKRREEAKRRSEEKKEKRRQQQQQQQQQQVDEKGSPKKAGEASSNKQTPEGKDTNGDNSKGPKLSREDIKGKRSTRRAERDQKRRQEFLRKKEEERLAKEKKGKGKVGGDENITILASVNNKEEVGDGQQLLAENKRDSQSTKSQGGGNESKDRDKDRPRDNRDDRGDRGDARFRNRRDRDRYNRNKERDNNNKNKGRGDDNKSSLRDIGDKSSNISIATSAGDSVNSSISNNTVTSSDTFSEVTGLMQQCLKTNLSHKSEDQRGKSEQQQRGSTSSSASPCPESSSRSAAEERRRIRNKDRPSIVIYQPKARLRASADEGSDGGGGGGGGGGYGKDDTPTPTSDADKSIKNHNKLPQKHGRDHQQQSGRKRVSRYSEQRTERRYNATQRQATELKKSSGDELDVKEATKADNPKEPTDNKSD